MGVAKGSAYAIFSYEAGSVLPSGVPHRKEMEIEGPHCEIENKRGFKEHALRL